MYQGIFEGAQASDIKNLKVYTTRIFLKIILFTTAFLVVAPRGHGR